MCTPLFHPALPIWRSPFGGSCFPFSFKYIILSIKPPCGVKASEHLSTCLLDITNRVKWHCNWISSTPRSELSANTKSASSVFAALRSYQFLRSLALRRWGKNWVTLTPDWISIIQLLGCSTDTMYRLSRSNHSLPSVIPQYSKVYSTMLMRMIASIIRKW